MMATFGTFTNGVSLKASEMNDLLVAVSSAPVIRQPNIIPARTTTGSAAVGKYFIVNKLVIYSFFWRAASGQVGTANNRIELDLPVTAASNSMRVIGSGIYTDGIVPPTYSRMAIVQYSTTRAAFLSETTTSLTTYVGQTNGPTLTINDGHQFSGNIVYEAA